MNLQLYFSIVVEVIIHLQNLRLTESRLIINCEYKYFFRLSCLTAFLWWRGENHSSISRIVSLVKFHSSRQGGAIFFPDNYYSYSFILCILRVVFSNSKILGVCFVILPNIYSFSKANESKKTFSIIGDNVKYLYVTND